MKKIVCILLIAVLVLSLSAFLFGCGSGPRDEVLKLYMPGEYIDEEIFGLFEEWYEQETGKKVKVTIETFDTVEQIQLAVEGSQSDYDLLCPSDYMVEYLVNHNLVQKVDKTILDVTTEGLFLEEYLNAARQYDKTLEYSVPYMYGTLGLVYDITKTGKKITSWDSFFGDEFKGHRSLKDSVRDAYAAACIYNAREELMKVSGSVKKALIQTIFEKSDASTVEAAKQTLLKIKAKGDKWDVDDVKFKMAANAQDAPTIALMWSCDAGYVMNTYEDANGVDRDGNRNLWYVVPEEGGNVYIDNFVINKYAGNVTAANYFLKFLCRKDIALKNCEYAGCVSPLTEVYNELYAYYTEDEDGMFADKPENYTEEQWEDWKAMFIETMFPSEETLNRCGVMRDLKAGNTAVIDMYSDIQ
ncbi:MAG: extracellular solute-binding protein [Clostridia bacterium]|nr:extracellular solute-binding protein [Clostridia bacterium]